jgi:voltage-gated potassium channel
MPRVDAWEERAEGPLTAAALVFLTAYALPVAQPDLDRAVVRICSAVVALTWVAFVVDYVARLVLSEDRPAFVRRHVLDLAVLVLPVLRPLRLLRLVALLSVVNRAGTRGLRGRVALYVSGGAAMLVLCGGLAVTDAERGAPGASIRGLGDGLWWALTTVTTVGYGDRYPVTATGRFVAAALMVGGIALLGAVTATLASWLVERVAEAGETEHAATREQVEALTLEVRALRSELAASRGVEPPSRV